MGASNVRKVYLNWPHLEDRPFRLLAYMALRARDNDANPWYGAGHTELAEIALGLPLATERQQQEALRVVRRAMTKLRTSGAITTTRRAATGRQARYGLHLNGPAQVTQRPMDNPADSHERRSPSDLREPPNVGHSVTFEHQNVGHSVAERRSLSGPLRTKRTEVVQEQEQKDPEANLRNGEMWKAPTPHPNGSAEPAKQATPKTNP